MSDGSSEKSTDETGGPGGVGGKAFDFAKKLLTVGIGTAFLTEEALKTLVAEFIIPKELIGGILESAKSVRKEFIQSFSAEMMGKISDKVDPATVMTQVMTEFLKNNDLTFEIKVKLKDKSKSET